MQERAIATVRASSDFKKAFRRLPSPLQQQFVKKEQWFKKNAFDPRLKTHKLRGALAGYWSYSINYEYRVLFRFVTDHHVLYIDVGTHAIYK